ncbi:transposase, partial [Alcaligenaceae bacterium]|nr:transposase [Alcaligenaceae bacterium]
MPNRTTETLDFGRMGRRRLQANFEGGDLSSDGGLMLLRQIDAHTGLSRLAAKALTERRDTARIHHRLRDVVAQRLYGLCCGYEDLNDHDTLRSDLLMQTAVGRDQALASAPTLSRLETGATRADAWALHRVLVEHFIGSFATAPKEL